MKRGRYNILLPNGTIKKFNVYMNDACTMFIYYERKYKPIVRKEPYKGGCLWQLRGKK